MKKIFAFLLITATFSKVAICQINDEKSIRAILKTQTEAWNNGDLDAFMIGYWQSDSLLFVGKSGVTYGYEQTLKNYKKSYGTKEGMGKLSFDIMQVKPLGTKNYFVLGKWKLTRSMGDLQGMYTLVFEKIKGEWKIVADHSSGG